MEWKWIIQIAVVVFAAVLIGAICPEFVRASNNGVDAAPVVSKIDIEIPGVIGGADRLVAMARGMILLREGERFSDEKLRKTVDLLKSSGIFQTIDVPDPDWSEREITVRFRLTPFRRIKDIKIYGAFPLLQKEVFNAMSIFTGDAFVPGRLKDQESLIARVFRDDGYLVPKIRVTSEEDPEDGNFVVTVTIEKGAFDRIRRVEIKGNRAFGGGRLKLRIDTWKASLFFGEIPRFIEKKLEKDVKNLTKFYRRKGYADVEVKSSVKKVSGTNDVIILLTVREGLKYKTRFEGNEEFWDFTLKKDLVLASGGNRSDLGLRKSIRNIRKRYRKAGYLDTRVRVADMKTGDGPPLKRNLQLTIEEGPRYRVGSIVIKGNTVFDDEKLKKQMLTRMPGRFGGGVFVPETLSEDISAIESLYLKNGYLNIAVTEEVKWRDGEERGQKLTDVVLVVDEGVQTRVASIAFSGLSVLSEAHARDVMALKEGEPFRKYMVQSDENRLSELISEKGYPHITVTGKVRIDKGSDGAERATVICEVDEGPHVKTGEIFYTGNFRTREKIFQKEVELVPDMPFSLTKMLETQRNIRNINALDSASFRVIGLKEKADRVNLLVEAEEKKPYYVEFGTGYDTRRKMYANTRLGDHNLLGLNKDGWVSAEWSQIGYRSEMGITEPRFLETRISSTLNLFGEDLHEFNKDFGTRTYGASLGFNRRFLRNFSAGLTYRYERRDQYQVGSEPIDPDDDDQFEPRSILVTTPSLSYNSTDSFIRPGKGVFASWSVDISQGIEDSQDDFFKHRYELRYYFTPFERLTFALRGRFRYIDPYGSNTDVPEDQLLFLGGTSDVRGFGENVLIFDADGDPVGGRVSILGSLEARFDLGLNFEFTTFYDTGSIRDFSETDDSEEFRSSVGAGLRYITPIGPIGFLYGWKLDQKAGESSGNFHFSIGYTF